MKSIKYYLKGGKLEAFGYPHVDWMLEFSRSLPVIRQIINTHFKSE